MYSLDVSSRMEVVVKTSGNFMALAPSIAAAVRQVAPQNALGQGRTRYFVHIIGTANYALSVSA